MCQSNAGLWRIQYWKCAVAIGNGLLPARKLSGVPRSRPNQRRCPAVFVGPFQILRIASASLGVRQGGPSAVLQRRAPGSYVHFRGSLMMPSITPSLASHAATAALVVAASFAALI